MGVDPIAGPSCPIAPHLLDGTAARLGAFISLAVLVTSVWGGWGLAVLGLALDFTLRAVGRAAWSPVARTAGWARQALGLPLRTTNAGPKRFAAALGAFCCLGIGASLLAGWRALGLGWAGLLAFCAGLEAFFGVCLACHLHSWLPWAGRPAA